MRNREEIEEMLVAACTLAFLYLENPAEVINLARDSAGELLNEFRSVRNLSQDDSPPVH